MQISHRVLCIALCLGFMRLGARAQTQSNDATPADEMLQAVDREIESLDRKKNSLKDRDIPLDWGQLYSELMAAKQQIQALDDELDSQRIATEQQKYLDALKELIKGVEQTHCETREQLQSLRILLRDARSHSVSTPLDNNVQVDDFSRDSSVQSCKAFQAEILRHSQDWTRRQQTMVVSWKNEIEKEKHNRQELKMALTAWRDKLQAAFDENKAKTKSQDTIANNLFGYLIVLAIFGLLMFAAIRLFPEAQQLQWIRSGQVIQTMTVIVLLFAILALGLSNKLKEDNLGTLLGGVAGYVLSTGIRRATEGNGSRQVGKSTIRGSGQNGSQETPKKDTTVDVESTPTQPTA